MTIGKKIKELRIKSGISQEQFAEDMQVSRQTVSKWENGMAILKTDQVETISNYFGLPIQDFFALGESSTEENLCMTIGEKIKELRIKNDVSQEQFAEDMKVSRQTVSSWEKDEKIPSKKNIERLAIFFKISENYFYRQEEYCSRSVLTDEDAQKDITPLTEQETAVSSCLLSSTPCSPESEGKSTKKSRKKIIITSVIFALAALSFFLVFLFDHLRYLEAKRLEEKEITGIETFTISTTDWVPLIIVLISLALIAFCGGLLIRHFIKQKKEKKHEKKK